MAGPHLQKLRAEKLVSDQNVIPLPKRQRFLVTIEAVEADDADTAAIAELRAGVSRLLERLLQTSGLPHTGLRRRDAGAFEFRLLLTAVIKDDDGGGEPGLSSERIHELADWVSSAWDEIDSEVRAILFHEVGAGRLEVEWLRVMQTI
jgi:hypothetical protein